MKLLTRISIIILSLYSYQVRSACVSAPTGSLRYNSSGQGLMQYCTGTGVWQNLGDSSASTGDVCYSNEFGKMKYAIDNYTAQWGMILCNQNGDWMSLTVNTGGFGTCTGAGRARYVAGSSDYQFCTGSVWYSMKDTASPPVTVCSTLVTQPTCDADSACSWNGSSCDDCPCKR